MNTLINYIGHYLAFGMGAALGSLLFDVQQCNDFNVYRAKEKAKEYLFMVFAYPFILLKKAWRIFQ